MTDVDFRRFASLLITLQLIGKVADPVSDAIEIADRLLDKLQVNE